MKTKSAFTLAEVLITLVIIGVIAAMTIPSLLNKTNEQESVSAVKKAYSTLSQAHNMVMSQDGFDPTDYASDAESTKAYGDLVVKYLNVEKNCGMTSDGDCFPAVTYKYLNGNNHGSLNLSSSYYKVRLNDNMSFSLYLYFTYEYFGSTPALKNVFGLIVIDVNGNKGPNTFGKDTFNFELTKYGVMPAGSPKDIGVPMTGCKTDGGPCTAWVILKGNMDYLRQDVSW
ncbi:MAG: type II secretion system protein [Candidatus Gastranaerophilales bacterium]|nr:type II secretion system protein [Candidatus Gastranaerophilales bacterium]